jgi:predicted kinase
MEMIILIGLQGAGKSTFYRQRFADTHALVSKDLLRNNKKPARRQRQLIEEALRAGHSLVVDNTNPTREERAELVRLGRQYGATVLGYYFEARVKQSLERNALREEKARVPDVAIFATMKKLVRPSYEEGFNQLFHVRTMGDMLFEVSDWNDEIEDGQRRF